MRSAVGGGGAELAETPLDLAHAAPPRREANALVGELELLDGVQAGLEFDVAHRLDVRLALEIGDGLEVDDPIPPGALELVLQARDPLAQALDLSLGAAIGGDCSPGDVLERTVARARRRGGRIHSGSNED
jgi:hypothetical protein